MPRRSATKDYNLKVLYPEVAKEWHPKKNKEIIPEEVTPGSGKYVWWRCKEGHEWEARVQARISLKTGCPYCAGQKASKGNSLKDEHPELVKEWHPTKNEDIAPDQVTSNSAKKVWWQCNRGHEWQASPNNRSRGTGCPHCSPPVKRGETFKILYPDLADELHPTKNRNLDLEELSISSSGVFWWKCPECKHVYSMTIRSRRQGRGCPKCNPPEKRTWRVHSKSLEATEPELAKEWDYIKNNILPGEINRTSWKKVWWKCKNGHSFQISVYTRVKKKHCPQCKKEKLK